MTMRRVFLTFLAGAVLCASACTTAVGGTPVADPKARTRTSEPSGPVTLTIMTPGDMGYEQLLGDYQRDHAGVRIELQKVGNDTYPQKLQAMLAAGTPPDVVVVAEEYRAALFNEEGQFADLSKIGPDDVSPKRWPDWKYKGGLAKDGRWVGYGVDSGPFGVAYRTDLFAAVGMPTDPTQVGGAFESWDSYFAAGDQYMRVTGKPWFDSGAQVFTAMQNQLPNGYFDEDGRLTVETDQNIKVSWDTATAAVGRGQSAKLTPFSPDWFAGFRTGAFATAFAPYWMLNLIKQNAGPENAGKWAIADRFPGGGANWGGSYLAVPEKSGHPEQAAELAAWLTAPEQQLRAFTVTGTFPSQADALKSDEVLGATDDYFATPRTGRTYAGLAGKIIACPFPSPRDSQVQNEAMIPALQAVEQGTPPDAGWQQAVAKAKEVAGG